MGSSCWGKWDFKRYAEGEKRAGEEIFTIFL
jgi:hypothetical protein